MDDMTMRYAHCEGHTHVCYDDSGKYLITCGTDGDIRIYEGFDDDDPKTHHMGEVVTAFAFKDKKLYISTDANTVVPYAFPEITGEDILLQFVISVYHITCSENGQFLAAGGGDFMIKVYDNVAKKFTPFKGHGAPILSLSIDPCGTYLASSSCDGTVKIWQLSDAKCVQTWSNLFKKSNDMPNSSTLCRIQWQPKTGKFIAIPVAKEVKFYERNSWNYLFSLTHDSIDQIVSLCSFSSCGTLIAAASTDGLVIVWDVNKKKFVAEKPHEKKVQICSLAWNPSGKKEIAFCDIEGQLGLFSDVGEKKKESEEQKLSAQSLSNGDLDDGSDDDDDADFNFDEDFNDESTITKGKVGEKMEVSDDEDNENAIDLGAIKAEYEPKIFGTEENTNDAASVKSAPAEPQVKVVEAPTTPLQTSFQPSSTPIHLNQRFMLWNSVGIVRCYNTEEETSIDVEFHDASIYHPINLNNNRGFTMAALSSEALLLAAPKSEDLPSYLQCLQISTWDFNKEWSMDMPEGEDIEAIALGSGWMSVATDLRLIRMFTVSGVQCEIFCCPGPVVCLATADNQLAIAFHRGPGITGEQNLGLMLVKVNLNSKCVCREYPLPLTSKAYLSWLGFTDEGQLCSVDTSGIVRMLNVTCMSKWLPIANLKSHVKVKSDNYFVVGLSEIQQEIRCIPCKGARYPPLLPRPTVTVLPFSLPFCETSSDKGRMEEENSRLALLHNRIKTLLDNEFDLDSEMTTVERKWTDVLLKMFALATRSDREYRALDIARLMPSHRIVQGAIKYATAKHHMALAERLGEVVHEKVMEEAAAAAAETEDTLEEAMVAVPVNNKILGSSAMENEDEKLQPKPLSRLSNKYSKETTSAVGEELSDDEPTSFQQQEKSPISLMAKSSPVVNPFKVQNKSSNPTKDSLLSNGNIDDLLDESTKRLSSKGATNNVTTAKKTGRQSKLFPQKDKLPEAAPQTPLAPKKFGFELYLSENKEKIKTDNPEAEEEEIVKIATKLFRALTPEEKAKYKAKPKNSKDKESEISNKGNKRKLGENGSPVAPDNADPKKLKTETKIIASTQNKLSMFAFTKTDEN